LHPKQRPLNCSKFADQLGLKNLAKTLPAFEGAPIRVRFLPELRAGRDKLYSRRPYGQPVYAASFIRRRSIVLDEELARKRRELARIVVHELFHFAWVRLGNRLRDSYMDLLREERKAHVRGELGWSAESRKQRLHEAVGRARREKRWRDYACESFCDTAAWMYAGIGRHPEFTLAAGHRARRAEWFRAAFEGREIPI